ncbi:MAG: hypothetical protein SGILL_007053, partial [Bacillariaceae sp.]
FAGLQSKDTHDADPTEVDNSDRNSNKSVSSQEVWTKNAENAKDVESGGETTQATNLNSSKVKFAGKVNGTPKPKKEASKPVVVVKEGEAPSRRLTVKMLDLHDELDNVINQIMSGMEVQKNSWESVRRHTESLDETFSLVKFDWDKEQGDGNEEKHSFHNHKLAQLINMATTNKKNEGDDAVRALVRAAAESRSNSSVQSIEVCLCDEIGEITEKTEAYYLCFSKTVRCRHEGKQDKSPPFLCLEDMSDIDEILVYYSSSGSGKTADLVGSSASRGSHLAIVLSVEDPTDAEYAALKQKAEREFSWERSHVTADVLAADAQIFPLLKQLLRYENDLIRKMVQAASNSEQPLKLVLAIDEGSSCPRVIRGILNAPEYIRDCVTKAIDTVFQDDPHNDSGGVSNSNFSLDLKVSIGGTGVSVSSTAIGSLPDNFAIGRPFHDEFYQTVIKESLTRDPINAHVPWSDEPQDFHDIHIFNEHLPVLSRLVRNGRMASIALAQLREQIKANNDAEVQEVALVKKTVEAFIASNGLCLLGKQRNEELRRQVAASALAVYLCSRLDDFKIRMPSASREIADWSYKMDFFEFSTGVTVPDLVKDYGLLEPSQSPPKTDNGMPIEPPLTMSTPQRLVAVFMLGLDMESPLDPSRFGFELMSTHLVKCALAASAAVHISKRPSVKCALSRLGFKVDEKATAGGVDGNWNSLDNFVPRFSVSKLHSPFHLNTLQLQAGLSISESDTITMDRNLMGALKYGFDRGGDGEHTHIPAIAAVNHGNSDLCDGIVTFHAQEKDDPDSVRKMSIMIQAKDYHESSKVDVTSLNEQAKKHDNEVLDYFFGKTRLFCVASTPEAVSGARKDTLERQYVPFVVSRGHLLSDILDSLQGQRDGKQRVEEMACCCDKDGNIVDDPSQSRKRKADT